MLSAVYAECSVFIVLQSVAYIECCYAEFRYAECCYDVCYCAAVSTCISPPCSVWIQILPYFHTTVTYFSKLQLYKNKVLSDPKHCLEETYMQLPHHYDKHDNKIQNNYSKLHYCFWHT